MYEFSSIPRFSGISWGVLCSLFRFSTLYLEITLDYTRERFSPPLQRPIASPDCCLGLWPMFSVRGSHDPSLGSSNLLEWLQNSGKHFTSVYQFRSTDEHSDGMFIEQVMWERLWALPCLLWAPTLPAPLCVHHRSSPTLVHLGFFCRPHPIGMVDY